MIIMKSIHNDKFLKSRCILTMVITVLFLLSITTVYAAPWNEKVTIIDGGNELTVYTSQHTVKDIIGEQGIEISDTDVIYPAVSSDVDDTHLIIIKRLRLLDVNYRGEQVTYWTDAQTYREFIKKGVIDADEDDIFDVDLDEKLEATGNKISIIKYDRVTETFEETIPYSSTTVYDDTLDKGVRTVTTVGQNGKKIKYYDVEYRDGVEVSRTFSGEEVSVQPVDEVITEGTKELSISVNGQVIPYKKVLTCQATAYDLSFESCGKYPGSPGYGITASGTYAKVGTVAVDPRVIPLGTKMYIVSTDGSYVYGYCTAEDTGGAIKGNKVDLFYNTRNECMQFGRRSVNVYIL
ncbi:MAG: DUF348 domain-containing protein [Ruminococcaceae bacterium]|nr:DUF348 domain-containing protein [Oscillospiraceae bacterium]